MVHHWSTVFFCVPGFTHCVTLRIYRAMSIRTSGCLGIRPGNKDGTKMGPAASRSWEIEVHPLHGLRYDESTREWALVQPLFNETARGLSLGSWRNQSLFRVNERRYRLLDALRFVANAEGTHVDTEKDITMQDMERVHFGHLIYPHIVAILVASYVCTQYAASRRTNNKEWQAFGRSLDGRPTDHHAVGGGSLVKADIEPMGLPGEFHDTGIKMPEPGKVWRAVQVAEKFIVRS